MTDCRNYSIARALILVSALSTGAAKAEPYIAGGIGYSFAQKIDSLKGNENTNYPDAPDNDPASPSYAPLLSGAKISPLKLEASPSVNIKGGYYLEKYPMLGFEWELAYSRPNFKRQNVTLTHDGFNDPQVAGQGYITEDQLYARSHLFVLSTNAMYRYQGMKDITPFIGAGPALFLLNIKGTGFSGIIVDPASPGSGNDGPRVNQTSVNIGLNLKAGVEYALTKGIGLGLEYHYNWAPIKVDNFRSISDAKGNFSSHTVGLYIAKHF
jgi:opacity protein-like surface antigen